MKFSYHPQSSTELCCEESQCQWYNRASHTAWLSYAEVEKMKTSTLYSDFCKQTDWYSKLAFWSLPNIKSVGRPIKQCEYNSVTLFYFSQYETMQRGIRFGIMVLTFGTMGLRFGITVWRFGTMGKRFLIWFYCFTFWYQDLRFGTMVFFKTSDLVAWFQFQR